MDKIDQEVLLVFGMSSPVRIDQSPLETRSLIHNDHSGKKPTSSARVDLKQVLPDTHEEPTRGSYIGLPKPNESKTATATS